MKRIESCVGAAALVILAACGGGGGGTPSGGGGTGPATGAGKTYAVPALPGEVSCWIGKGGVEFATGYEEGALEYFVRRGWDAGTSTLTEDTLTIVKGNGSRSWQTIAVDGGALTIAGKYPGGTWRGTGTADGDAPAWARVTTAITLDAGTSVASEYTAQAGGVSVQSMVSGPDGTQLMRFTIELTEREAAACDAVFAKHAPVP